MDARKTSDLGNKEILARNLQNYLDLAHKTRNDLAKDLGFKYTTVSNWLQADRYPRIEWLHKEPPRRAALIFCDYLQLLAFSLQAAIINCVMLMPAISAAALISSFVPLGTLIVIFS